MQFVHVDPARIEREWPVIAEILAPAVRNDPKQTLEGLHKRLTENIGTEAEPSFADSLLLISGPGNCLMVVEVDSGLVLWTKYLAGHIEGGPKARMAIIRGAVDHLEKYARAAGCTEHRLCGRETWARILPDYQPFDGQRNGLMKELA